MLLREDPVRSDLIWVGGRSKETGRVSLALLLQIPTVRINRKKGEKSFEAELSI